MQEDLIALQQEKKVGLTPRELVFRYLPYLPWVVLSLAVIMVLAYLKLRYSPVIYKVTGKLLVTNNSNYGSGGGEKFDDIFMMKTANKINDEIEIIKSRTIASRVINYLGLQTTVTNKGTIRSSVLHPKNLPFKLEILRIVDSTRGFGINLKLFPDHFTLNEQPKTYFFNEIVTLPGFSFRIQNNGTDMKLFASNEFSIGWQPMENLSSGLSKTINVGLSNDFTNVLNISYDTENTLLGKDIVDAYMREYKLASLEDKREMAANTLMFIDRQLDTVQKDLVGSEKGLQDFRETNKIFDVQAQSQIYFDEYAESNKGITAEELKIKIIDYLSSYLTDQKNAYEIVPSLLGIEEPSLAEQVLEYNRLQLERATLLKSTPPGNRLIKDLETGIDKIRSNMIENLRNVKKTHEIAINQLSSKNIEAYNIISKIPAKEKQLLEVTRQRNLLQELYSFLLQKKLETSIASASTISNIKVLETGMATGGPISPNRKATYIFAFLIGIGIPVGIIFLREYLNDKIKNKQEIQQITDVPILGEIGHAADADTLVVTKHSRKFLAEQFRIIRSNFQYIIPKPEKLVLLVTSSFSGEGKSFISTNLGAVLALSGKKTVILEFDIRKPKIMKGLGLKERSGITNFIVGAADINDVIYPVPESENLFVMPCGPVPPNPSEMLLSAKVTEMFRLLRERFDAIIIDTAPVGLVSDGITLGEHADAAVYIVRHNYTLKKQIHLVDDLYKQKKLPISAL